jgi:hypothetical protein
MLSHAGLPRQQTGLLCYTSVVISFGCAGFGAFFLQSAGCAGSRCQFVHAAAMAAGKLRGMLRVFRRGKGF